MIHPVSKNKMHEWINSYDINNIFKTELNINKLSSDGYWQKWSRININDLQDIANKFFAKCLSFVNNKEYNPYCSFDTTNFYLFIATQTESELAARGKNKQGRDNLRQIGLSLLVDNKTGLILHYKVYKGNKHDSDLFSDIIDDVILQAQKCGKTELIIVFDKGINSEDNINVLDNKDNVSFITSYSPSDKPILMSISLDRYHVVDCKHNRLIDEEIKLHPDKIDILEAKKVKACHIKYNFWGKERNVVLLYNPDTEKKQRILLDKNIETLRRWIVEAQKKVKLKVPYYRTKSDVMHLYNNMAKKCHLSPAVFELTFSENNGLKLYFKKRSTFINDYIKRLGKSILISNNLNLSCEKIVQLHFDKNVVENAFRQCKDNECCSVWPVHHWTDRMIECHIFCSLVAYSYLKIIELILIENWIEYSAKYILNKMAQIYSTTTILILPNLNKKEYFTLSNIDEVHKKIFSIFNYKYIDNKLSNQLDISPK